MSLEPLQDRQGRVSYPHFTGVNTEGQGAGESCSGSPRKLGSEVLLPTQFIQVLNANMENPIAQGA